MNTDPLFSDDVEILRREIVSLRSRLDVYYQVIELYRSQSEHLKSILESLISNGYGKS